MARIISVGKSIKYYLVLYTSITRVQETCLYGISWDSAVPEVKHFYEKILLNKENQNQNWTFQSYWILDRNEHKVLELVSSCHCWNSNHFVLVIVNEMSQGPVSKHYVVTQRLW